MYVVFLGLGGVLALVYLGQLATGIVPEGHWQRSAAKTGATVALVAAGWVSDAPGLVLLGLALGAAGDFFLSRRGQVWFLAGMAAFAVGHLAYVDGFWARANALGFTAPGSGQWALLGGLAVLIAVLGRWLSAHADDLRLPVRGYALVIGLMAAAALILPEGPGRGLIWVGVGLFVLSDTLLALRLFVAGPAAHRPLDLAIWPAYWLGQALILSGALRYWAFPVG